MYRIAHRLKSYVIKPEGVIPLAKVAPYLPTAPVIVEAGAHLGFDTLAMSRFWPRGQIHAFEPVPDIYEQLGSRVKARPNVTCYPLALGTQEGISTMYVSSGASNASSSLLPPKEHLVQHADVLFEKEIQIKVTTLDVWTAQHGIPQVDFLWLDMQGYELAALKASTRTLKMVKAIHTEVFLKENYEGSPLYPQVRTYLEGQGFKVIVEELPWPDSGNVLFART